MPFQPTFRKPESYERVTLTITAPTVDINVFYADLPMVLISATYVPNVAGSDAGTVTGKLFKASGTTAPASGTAIQSNTFNLKGTASTAQSAALTASAAKLAPGDRIGFVKTGTTTAVLGTLTLVLSPA